MGRSQGGGESPEARRPRLIRIFSARPVTKKERKDYEESTR